LTDKIGNDQAGDEGQYMKWLENLVVKLANRVDNQLDDLTEKKAFDTAQDAYFAGDLKTALAGYSALAEKGHGRAAALAGEMHLSGKGTPVSGTKAVKYFEMGAAASDPDATALLGMALAAGMAGVKVDLIRAKPFLQAAANNGDAKSKEMLTIVIAKQKGKRK
jgi:TPR repeat protein